MVQTATFVVQAKDEASKVFKSIGDGFNDMSWQAKKFWDGVATGVKRATDAIENNRASIESIRNRAWIAFAAISAGVYATTAAYAEAEWQQRMLETAILDVTGWTREQLKAMEDLSAEIERKWVLDGDAVKQGIAQLSTFRYSIDTVKQLSQSMSDLAVNQFWVNATWDDLQSSANMVAKAMRWEFGILEKSWIVFSEAQKNMINFGTESEKAAAVTQGLAENMKRTNASVLETSEGIQAKLNVSLWNAVESIGGALTPALNSLRQAIMPIIDGFTSWASSNPELVWNLILIAWGVAGIIAAIAAFWLVIPAIVTWMTAIWAALTLMTWPIWIAIAVVWLLVTAFVTDFGWIRTFVEETMTAIWGFLSMTWAAISSAAIAVWDGIVAYFTFVWETIQWFFYTAWVAIVLIFQAFGELFSGNFTAFWEWIKTAFFFVWDSIAKFFKTTWTTMSTIAKDVWTAIYTWIVAFITSIATFFTTTWKDLFVSWFTSMVDGFVGIVKNVANGVIWIFEWMVNGVVRMLNKLIEWANSLPWISIPILAEIQLQRLAHGGFVTWSTLWQQLWWVKGYQSGWLVTWPQWVDKVPAMLTAGELVLNKAQQENLASNLSGWQWTTVMLTISWNNFYGDDESFAEKIWNMIVKDLSQSTIFQSF